MGATHDCRCFVLRSYRGALKGGGAEARRRREGLHGARAWFRAAREGDVKEIRLLLVSLQSPNLMIPDHIF